MHPNELDISKFSLLPHLYCDTTHSEQIKSLPDRCIFPVFSLATLIDIVFKRTRI